MIKIEKGSKLITIKGHANFDEHGKDIVCASVSSIVYTTVNAILNFDNEAIEFMDDEFMSIIICDNTQNVKVLIKNMFDLLHDLEEKYPKNIKIISKGD